MAYAIADVSAETDDVERKDDPTATKTILIAGPTASGKSKLAMAIARAHNGVVVNADSMQVYRELSILTARPSAVDEAVCPHRLYGHVSLREHYSVAIWLREVAAEINDSHQQGLLPIIVGGTGLNFMALTDGLAPVPEIPTEVRARWRQAGLEWPVDELHTELRARDPEMAERLRASDRQRVVRALEVIDGTGHSLRHWHDQRCSPVLSAGSYTGLVVERPREEIYRACDARMDAMVHEGALDEVRLVRDMQLKGVEPGMRALGLLPFLKSLEGELGLDDALELAKRDTRRYAKRQLTWLRRNMIAWNHLSTQDIESIASGFVSFIDS